MNSDSNSKLENSNANEAGGIKVGDVSNATGVIIGENIKTGDININIVYETAKNYGLTLIDPTYFKDNQQTDANFESWKRGFPLKLPSVMNGSEFRREHVLKDIKDKLESTENNHRLLLLGKPGSSKSTVLMEIMCDYFENNYQIMYNWGNTKIENSQEVVRFIGKLLNNGNKILIAVDNIHLENAVGIFPIIDALTTHNKRENLRILLTARISDYNRFLDEGLSKLTPDIRSSLREIDKENFRYPLPNFSREEIKEFIEKYQNEPQVKQFISKHSSSNIVKEQTYEELAGMVSDQTKGDPIKIKFLVFGKGLAVDARNSYDDFLQDNEKKIITTVFCSLLNIINNVASKKSLQENNLLEAAQELVEEFVLEKSDAGYQTKHPNWDLELFSYLLNVNSIGTLQIRKEHLKNALNLLFHYEDITFTTSLISALFDMTTIETEEGKKIPIFVIDDVLVFPTYLDNNSKFNLYCFDIGRCYFELGYFQIALDSTLKAIDIDAANPQAWNNKGLALGKLGRQEEEIAAYKKALEIDPKYATAWKNKGVALGKLGRQEEEIAAYKKALEIDPKYVDAWDNKGVALGILGRYEDAIAANEKALELDPKNITAWYNKGIVLAYLGRYEDAIAANVKALELDPKFANAWYNRAVALGNLGRHEDAIVAYEKALELDPKNITAWYNKGIALGNLGRNQDATVSFEKALELDPKFANAWYNRAVALGNLGRHEDAIVAYEKALELDPKYVDAWYNKSLCLHNLERYEDAVAAYDKVLELDPKYVTAWYHKGLALRKLGRYEDAIAANEKALELDPKYVTAWYHKGIVLAYLGRYEDAIAAYEKVLELDPTAVNVWYNKGAALGDLGRYDDAIVAYEKALEQDPKNVNAWYHKGIVLGNLGRNQDAISAYKKALEIDPKYVDAWYKKASCLVRENTINDALDHLEKAIYLGGQEYAKEARKDNDFEGIRNNKRFIKLVNS